MKLKIFGKEDFFEKVTVYIALGLTGEDGRQRR